jgi:hypothetical protein
MRRTQRIRNENTVQNPAVTKKRPEEVQLDVSARKGALPRPLPPWQLATVDSVIAISQGRYVQQQAKWN